MLCFAYGSNMSTKRLAARIPARFVTTALLPCCPPIALLFTSVAGTVQANVISCQHQSNQPCMA